MLYEQESTPTHLPIRSLAAAIAVVLISYSGQTLAQQEDTERLEEVIVTGSLIRRTEGFVSASPMTQITAADLADGGSISMADVVNNMTFNMGTTVTDVGPGNEATTRINLRGLGSRATLQLLDGKRIVEDNVNHLLPMIAIQRIDVVVDGAAATYGTDAVAGVVNMVPYSRYEGVEMELYQENTTSGGFVDRQVSLLAGTRLGGSIDLVGAASFRDHGKLNVADRNTWTAGLRTNSVSNPASYRVPQRDQNGDLTGTIASIPDPLCGTGPQVPTLNGYPYGILSQDGRECLLEWKSDDELMGSRTQSQFFGKATYDGISGVTLSSSVSFSRFDRYIQRFSSFPTVNEGQLPRVRGELPGNPYRAMSSDNRELFAEPLRDSGGNIVTDGYARPLPLRGNDGNVVLANNRFVPIDIDPSGGVPFYEDVGIQQWEPFGKFETNTCPQVMYDWARRFNNGREDLCLNYRNQDERLWRMTFDADYDVPFLPDWRGTSFITYSSLLDVSEERMVMSRSAVIQGLNCDVVNDVGSCFNPFAATMDSPYRTPQAVADSIYNRDRGNNENVLQTFDTHFNGTIPLGSFELPGGAIGAAIGYQHRFEKQRLIPAASISSGDGLLRSRELPRSMSRSIDAGFAELSLPILSNLEVGFNVRTESYSTGQSTTVGKLGVAYEPTSWLTLRGTMGEAFVAPSMNQLDSPETCGLANVVDPFTGTQGFVVSCRGGNPNLLSEASDVWTVGFDVSPIDRMTVSGTFSEVDFTDRIVNTSGQVIVDLDFAKFREATGFQSFASNPYPSSEMIRSWNTNSSRDRRIFRDAATIELIDRVDVSTTNAARVLVRSFDLDFRYSLPFRDWGIFSFRADATHTLNFTYQENALSPVVEGAGRTNSRTGTAPAVPKWRANTNISWSRGPHRINSAIRYVGSADFDGNQSVFTAALPGSTWRQVDTIRPWTHLDLFYSYEDLEIPGIGGTLSFTAGSRNVTDRRAQKAPLSGGFVGEMHSDMGRIVYGRLNYRF